MTVTLKRTRCEARINCRPKKGRLTRVSFGGSGILCFVGARRRGAANGTAPIARSEYEHAVFFVRAITLARRTAAHEQMHAYSRNSRMKVCHFSVCVCVCVCIDELTFRVVLMN